jgi:hypothetical protein
MHSSGYYSPGGSSDDDDPFELPGRRTGRGRAQRSPRSGRSARSASRSPLRLDPARGAELGRTRHLMAHVAEDLREAMRRHRADLVAVFESFDRNGDGLLTRRELNLGLQSLDIRLSAFDLARLVDALDQNGDGLIEWREFLELVAPLERQGQQPSVRSFRDRRRKISFHGGDGLIDDEEEGGSGRQAGVARLPAQRTVLDMLLKAHCCCELVWVMLTLLVGFNAWSAWLVAWNLFPIDGHCPEPASCGSAASWFVGLAVWQPMLTIAGAVGLLARPMASEPQVHYISQMVFSGMYWCGCVTGLIVVVAQLVVVVGGTSGLLTDLDNIAPTRGGTSDAAAAATCTVWINQGRINAARSSGRGDRRAQETPLAGAAGGDQSSDAALQMAVTGMCAGNTDVSQEPDIVCPAPSLPRQDYYEIAGRDVASCCGCEVGIRDFADGKCVLTADPDASLENACTAVMRYAECGSDAEVTACIANPDSCGHCAQPPPYAHFAHLADVDSSRASSLCMSANRFGCTFMFKRLAEQASCIDDRCAGNTAVGVQDVHCEAPTSLRPNAATTRGRNASTCCHISGLCIGNTDGSAEPDVFCEAPGELRPGADMVVGRDEATCCITHGKCVGNTDGDEEPDIVCAPPSELEPEAAMISGRDEHDCCHVTGMCVGNTDAGAEPDIVCPGVGHIKPDARLIKGRQYSQCCYVTGMCIGNSDLVAEPDIVCNELDERASLLDGAAETTGRDYDSCCHIVGYCSANTNPEEDVVCVAPSTAVANAAVVQGSTTDACCHTIGMCAGNTDQFAQPDVVCTAPSVLVENPSAVQGRGDECCVCHDNPIARAHCVTEADQRPELDNRCTRIMLYAGCHDDAMTLACAADPGAAETSNGSACSDCADPSFEAFYARSAADRTSTTTTGVLGGMVERLSAQELCMEGELYACHYDFATFLEPCTARAEPVGSVQPTASPQLGAQLGSPAPTPTGTGGAHGAIATAAAGEGCTCEARSVARLMSNVNWDVGLSDAFIWFVFDLLLLSLLRVGGIRYAMSHTDLMLIAEDRGALI